MGFHAILAIVALTGFAGMNLGKDERKIEHEANCIGRMAWRSEKGQWRADDPERRAQGNALFIRHTV
jgi:hypothetical protein